MTAPPYNDLLDYVLIDAERLQKRITELGEEITADYRQDHDVFLIGILKGSMLFMADLMRRLDIPHMVDFLDVTSYGAGARESTGYVRILMDLHTSIEKKNVLIGGHRRLRPHARPGAATTESQAARQLASLHAAG